MDFGAYQPKTATRPILGALVGVAVLSAIATGAPHAGHAAQIEIVDITSQTVLLTQTRYSGSAFILSPGQEIRLVDTNLISQEVEGGPITPNAVIKRVKARKGPRGALIYTGVQINVLNTKFRDVVTVDNFITRLRDRSRPGVLLRFADSGKTYYYTDDDGRDLAYTVPVFQDLSQVFPEVSGGGGKLFAGLEPVNRKLGDGPIAFAGTGYEPVFNVLGDRPTFAGGKLAATDTLADPMYLIWEDSGLYTGIAVPPYR